jgi:microcystin-dependent protein
MVLQVDGTVRQWQPTDTGDNFLAYWDGTQWKIGNLASLLPAGNGVLVKNGSSFSLANGVNGEFLQVLSGSIQFNSTIPGGMPTGSIISFAGTTTPSGWILCDGSLYGRTNGDPSPQPNLFNVIGITYGAGDSLTTFAVPDLRGMFVRGIDNGRNIDPLRAFGSQQADSFKSHNHSGNTGLFNATHTHSFSGTTGVDSPDHTHSFGPTGGAGSVYWFGGSSLGANSGNTGGASTRHTHTFSGTTSSGGSDHSHTIASDGQTETRPINVAMNYIIKT